MCLVLLAVFFWADPVCAGTVRSKSDMRLWETVADRTVPLSWPWEGEADGATLAFSNRLTRAVDVISVSRNPGDVRGSHMQPVTQPGVEALVDVLLVQTNGPDVVARESATLAYVSGAGGGPITVQAIGTPERELARLRKPRVYAFDPAWQGLDGESGYDVAWPTCRSLRIVLR